MTTQAVDDDDDNSGRRARLSSGDRAGARQGLGAVCTAVAGPLSCRCQRADTLVAVTNTSDNIQGTSSPIPGGFRIASRSADLLSSLSLALSLSLSGLCLVHLHLPQHVLGTLVCPTACTVHFVVV